MTDTELLDGLQRLLQEHVTVLRTCRSGAKIELSDGTLEYFTMPDDKGVAWSEGGFREYFGGSDMSEYRNDFGKYGPDIRVAIQRAIEGEAT